MNPCISTHTLYITFFYLLTNYAIKFNGFYFFFMQTLWTLLHIFTLTTFMYMLLNVTSLMGSFWTHNVLKIIMQGLFLYFICYSILNHQDVKTEQYIQKWDTKNVSLTNVLFFLQSATKPGCVIFLASDLADSTIGGTEDAIVVEACSTWRIYPVSSEFSVSCFATWSTLKRSSKWSSISMLP